MVYSETIAEKIRQLKRCPFCRLQCSCDRCGWVKIFTRLMAYYHAIGGNFEDMLADLLFLNLESQEIFVQLVTF